MSVSGVLLGTLAAALIMDRYEARMQLFVNRGRVDPVVTADAEVGGAARVMRVTEEELNSEVALLTSDALLSRVAVANGLQERAYARFRDNSEAARVQRATAGLKSKLSASVLRKSDVIEVTFTSSDPEYAASILQSLATLYMEKHKEVRRAPGQQDFFDQQVLESKHRLAAVEQKLAEFAGEEEVVSPALERDQLLQKMSELNLGRQQARAGVTETKKRIATLMALADSTPARITRQMRSADNPALMQQLKSTLLDLELKRAELLAKYQPTYRPVVDLEKQIAETRAAIEREERRPLREETTDQNPTHEWVRSELARARADLSAHQGRADATQALLQELDQEARKLDDQSLRQQELLRQHKAEQDTYLLYLRKREEARINEAMDERGMLNVALAQEPVVPALPSRSLLMIGLTGLMAAFLVTAVMVLVAERLDQRFHTPDQIREQLGTPVLAALPERRQLALTGQ